MTVLNPFPEKEPAQGGKVQAGPASCQDGPGKVVFVSPFSTEWRKINARCKE